MRRLSQAIGFALVLALSLGPDRAEAAERDHLQGDLSRRLFEDASTWLPSLEDVSLDVGQRLEVAVSDPKFVRWLGDLLAVVPPLTPTQAIAEMEASELSDDPVLRRLAEGVRALEVALNLLPPDATTELESADEPVFEPYMLDEAMAILTSPEVPELIGDELQYFAEGFVALFGAALLDERNASLALELADAFVERAERVPRLIVLLAIWREKESELAPHDELVTSSDRGALARDQMRAEQSVANLRRLAELERSFWS